MRLVRHLTIVALALLVAAPVYAQFPERPLTVVVGFRAGGGSDTSARILAKEIEGILGQKVIVENRGGGGGAVAAEYIRRQPADGYRIGFAVATTFAFTPLTGKVKYTADDVDFVATTHGYRVVFISPKDAPFSDWAGLLATAKKRKWLNYASIIPLDRTIIQYIGKREGIAVNIVPTRGGAGARQAVLGGHVDLALSGSNALPMFEQGALKIVAALNPEGIAEHRSIPTLRSLGYDAFLSEAAVFFGPRGMDAGARRTLEGALRKAVQSAAFKEFVNKKFRGFETFLDGAGTRRLVAKDAAAYKELLAVLAK